MHGAPLHFVCALPDGIACVQQKAMEEGHSVRYDTISSRFLEATDLEYRCAMTCPPARLGWTMQWKKCSSPFCHGFTGPWVPSRSDALPMPCCDSIHGSVHVAEFLQGNTEYRYVACSVKCHKTIEHIRHMRHDRDQVLIGVLNYRGPVDDMGSESSSDSGTPAASSEGGAVEVESDLIINLEAGLIRSARESGGGALTGPSDLGTSIAPG